MVIFYIQVSYSSAVPILYVANIVFVEIYIKIYMNVECLYIYICVCVNAILERRFQVLYSFTAISVILYISMF